MKELDFDELDRAVNSLMAGASSTNQKSEPSEKVLEVPTTALAPTTPSPSMSTPVTAPPVRSSSPVQTPVRSSPAPAARRGGRFMDVVHPSQGVKKEVSKPVTREAATIQPSRNLSTLSQPELAKPVEASKTPEVAAPKNDWPDPLDMANFSGSDEKNEESAPQDKPTPVAPEPTKKDEDSPLVSPFLPDTKVEKRPLGGNVSQNDTPVLVPAVENIDDQLPATIEDTKPLLPEEFHSDLVAIEADTTHPEKHNEHSEASIETPRSANDNEEVGKKAEPQTPEKEKASIPAGSGSIPQQYKEEQPTGNQENGAIYDTDTYHQPLSHPAKQKSGWMWVVWIILILVIGAGGGAALYLLGIIR